VIGGHVSSVAFASKGPTHPRETIAPACCVGRYPDATVALGGRRRLRGRGACSSYASFAAAIEMLSTP
jgi:hypothetical protein